MHPKIMTNEKDNKIFSSRIVVPSENEIWAIKKNSGSGIKAINTLFHKFLELDTTILCITTSTQKYRKKLVSH